MKRHVVRLAHEISHVTGMALRKARAIMQPRVLMYHTVDPEGISMDVFRAQLDVIHREFEPISLPALLERYRDGRCTGREVALTFDDGVRNHLTTVYPLLREAGVPATFFLCSGLIDSGQWVWNTEARARLQGLRATERKALATEEGWPVHTVEALVEWAKGLAPDRRTAFETAVRGRTPDFVPTPLQRDLYAPMTWDEVQSLDPALITIGSHTVTHPILTTLSAQDQAEELTASRARLEAQLGREVDIFCYPNGDSDPGVVEAVRQSYRWAVTTEESFWGPGHDPCRLPRIPAAPHHALFVRRMHKPTS